MSHHFLKAFFVFAVLSHYSWAEKTWISRYYTCFSSLPGSVLEDRAWKDAGKRIRLAAKSGNYDKSDANRKQKMLSLANMLENSLIVWTNTDNKLALNFLTPQSLHYLFVPASAEKLNEERISEFGDPVTDHSYDLAITDAKMEFPPFFSQSILTISAKNKWLVSATTGAMTAEKGLEDDASFYHNVQLMRSAGPDDPARMELQSTLIRSLKNFNEQYLLDQQANQTGSILSGRKVAANADFEQYDRALNACMREIPNEERELRNALGRAKTSFEKTFGPEEKRGKGRDNDDDDVH